MEARSSQCLQSLHEDNGTSRMGLRLRQGPRLLHGSRPRFDRSVEPGVRKNAKERCEMAFASTLMRIRFTCEPVPFIGVLRAFRTKHSVVNGGSGNAGRCRHAVRWDAGFRRPGPLPITRPYVKSARPRFDSRREIPFASVKAHEKPARRPRRTQLCQDQLGECIAPRDFKWPFSRWPTIRPERLRV